MINPSALTPHDVKVIRKSVLGMSQAEMASALGVRQQTVSAWEVKGIRRGPLAALLRSLGDQPKGEEE